jgi:acetyl esterase
MPDDVHPQIQAILDAIAALGQPNTADVDAPAARALAEAGVARMLEQFPPVAVAQVEMRSTGPGYRHVPVRIYRDTDARDAPALVYFHGGGHVICSLDTHDHVCRNLCRESGGVVISVDYAMGPEQPFPEGVEDCFAALRWVADHGRALGIDPARIAVGGDSAGGNLAAVVALMARDAGGPAIAAQALVYPVVDYRGGTPSYERYGKGYGPLETDTVDWFRRYYFADDADMDDWRAAPHLAPSHANLPPALVLLAECDVLHDEGVAYARQLEAAGVAVEAITYPGMIHAFYNYLGPVDDAARAHRDTADFLRRHWGTA